MLAQRVLSRGCNFAAVPRQVASAAGGVPHRAAASLPLRFPQALKQQRDPLAGQGLVLVQRRRCAAASMELTDELLAEIREMPIDEQESLANAMLEGDLGEAEAGEAFPMTQGQINKLFIATAIPMVGFGFMDNAVMIICGEFIEIKLGAAFCISTLAAAGFGNLISDLVGLGAGGLIESGAAKLGIEAPPLTAAQLAGRTAIMTRHAGSVLGLGFGCVIGMFPLLWHNEEDVRMKKIFCRYDNDGNGALDRDEIILAFKDAKMYPSDEDLHHLFEKYDLDQDGVIEYNEFKEMCEELEQRQKHNSVLDARGLWSAEAMYLEMDH